MQDVGMSQTFEDVAKAPTEAITQTQACYAAHVLGGTLIDQFIVWVHRYDYDANADVDDDYIVFFQLS